MKNNRGLQINELKAINLPKNIRELEATKRFCLAAQAQRMREGQHAVREAC